MGKYGEVAVMAAQLLSKKNIKPIIAWDMACKKIIESNSGRDKGCPRNAFLGLCGAGLLSFKIENDMDIQKAVNSLNGKYAIAATKILEEQPQWQGRERELWLLVLNKMDFEQDKTYNCQMDVVLSLWNASYIIYKSEFL